MVCCKQEFLPVICQSQKEKLGKWSKNMQPWYPLTLARDQPRPAFSRTSRLRYHNNPSLTFFSCLCILIFSSLHLPLLDLVLVLTHFSLSQLLPDLNHIIVRAPGAGADTHPSPLLRQTEGEKRKRQMRERKDCVSVSSLSPPSGRRKIHFSFGLKH